MTGAMMILTEQPKKELYQKRERIRHMIWEFVAGLTILQVIFVIVFWAILGMVRIEIAFYLLVLNDFIILPGLIFSFY